MPRKIATAPLNTFLLHFGRSGSVSYAADRAGLGRSTLYYRRHNDPVFAARWAAAAEQAAMVLQDQAVERIVSGGGRVFRRGRSTGRISGYDNGLLMTLLRALRPEVYRRRRAGMTEGQVPNAAFREAWRLFRREGGGA
jgi:hypothetical protein